MEVNSDDEIKHCSIYSHSAFSSRKLLGETGFVFCLNVHLIYIKERNENDNSGADPMYTEYDKAVHEDTDIRCSMKPTRKKAKKKKRATKILTL